MNGRGTTRAAQCARRRAAAGPGCGGRVVRRAFSMAELMIAVVILGIGLLITSSMFPIAWYKAREVAEAAVIPALANTAEVNLKLQCRRADRKLDPTNPRYTSSFFPGDWVPTAKDHGEPLICPDTHVHLLNAGNYLADTGEDFYIDDDNKERPVADDAWMLEDNLDVYLAERGALQTGFNVPLVEAMRAALGPQVSPQSRLALPLGRRPRATDTPAPHAEVMKLWQERFDGCRHSWAVFYRFSELPGAGYAVFAPIGNPLTDPQKEKVSTEELRQPRQLNVYCVTLKRPIGARYARQQGYDPQESSPEPADLTAPEPRDPEFDVLLPVPWRFEAELAVLPIDTDPNYVPGAPAEIIVKPPTNTGVQPIMLEALDKDFYLIDDRTGQVFTVTNRRTDGLNVVLTLDSEYTRAQIIDTPEYEPQLSGSSVPAIEQLQHNWKIASLWKHHGCDIDPDRPQCDSALLSQKEDEPERRTYWVYLPPVEQRSSPSDPLIFSGTQPVVAIEVRQIAM